MVASPLVTVLLLVPPAAFALVAALAATAPGRRPRAVLRLLTPLTLLALAGAAAAASLVVARGAVESPALGAGLLTASLRLDALSAPLLVLVSLLGAIVLRFSRHYLDGDARHGAFLGQLALTVGAALLLVMAGTLTFLLTMWIASSLALHRLLRFYADRRGAVTAARKKFVVARVADVALTGAGVLLADAFGTVHIGTILAGAQEMAGTPSAIPTQLHAAVALLVLAAAFKSAQFPTHGWLVDVMEAPTPVSALLHAGLLNAGPFLILRLAPVLLLSPGARVALLALALLTALTMALSMAAQTRIKTALGYSSAAHMGFSLALSALGLFPLALLHLVAHSCYKAHAFLRSGSAVEPARTGTTLGLDGPLAPGAVAGAIAVSVALVAAASRLAGGTVAHAGALLGLAALLAIGLVPLLARGFDHGGTGVMQPLLASGAVACAFFLLERAVTAVPSSLLPMTPAPDAASQLLLATAVCLGAVAVWLPLFGARGALASLWTRLYLRARNGWYANVRFDAVVGSYRTTRPLTLASELPE